MDNLNVGKLPVKNWCTGIEESARSQIANLANLPFAFSHIAIMPDCHAGYGMPIGSVLATKDVIIPNAVGVDIGCGMLACQTYFTTADLSIDLIKEIMAEIRKVIPVGFNKHPRPQEMPKELYGDDLNDWTNFMPVVAREFSNAQLQLGTLGGGNHFIELQADKDGYVWVMIHSGSRNLGKQVCDHYNDIAKAENWKWFSQVPVLWDLAFLPVNSDVGKSYIMEMQYCVNFALANRQTMMTRILDSMAKITHAIPTTQQTINIAHNYAALENHFGHNVWVHRKGATRATKDLLGIIPGSQGTASYIVKGKGNRESFMSCSHGAGRAMGRKEAQRTLDLEDEIAKLDAQGIVHGIRHKEDLDEASGAYKDIDIVMENQKDLVDIVYKLRPLAVVKG